MQEQHAGGRWHWGRMLLLGALGLFILLFAAHLVWTFGARNRLNALTASYKAAGEPIEPGDFIVHGVADADNAAIPLREAANSIDAKAQAWKTLSDLKPASPLTAGEIAAIQAALAANPKAFGLIDEAMRRKAVDWKVVVKSPVINVLLPNLTPQRRVATLATDRALLEHQQGDDAAALADIDRVLFISRTMEKHPMLVSHLVAIGMRNMACDAVEQIAPALKIGTDKGDVPSAAVKALIAELLDEKSVRAGQRLALLSERMFELDSARSIANGTFSMSGISGPSGRSANVIEYLARPTMLGDGVIMLRRMTAILAAAQKSADWPTYREIVPPIPPQVRSLPYLHILASALMPDLSRIAELDYRIETEGRMAAVSLAVRLYRVDHAEALPTTMTDLVPAYLPAVPLDSMAVNQPLKYTQKNGNPIVYSIGENGTDDGGSEASNNSSVPARSKWQEKDVVTHLTTQPRKD